ncbi:lipopolysaccharide export system protein LptA [Thermodesulfovibrio aggregans]|uniref:Lipopolysaccharide export system protein LptA n=1 Tax=Thermodesulfovibrio aggregans TaxID=86166 RepID=A0A0U9HYN1_9BACT|nr:lipopolysaccharide export system protein LptA [Thermodesulfovibrio aggregans]
MYILRSSIIFLTFFLLLINSVFAEEKKEMAEPIVITSKTLINDSKTKTATFEGNVVAKRGEVTLYANKMIVYYEDEQKGGNIKMIEAIGDVRLVKADRVITSHKATYLPEPEERVIFTGEPRATEGKNLVTGEKITYFVKDDRSLVEKSKVYLKEKKAGK